MSKYKQAFIITEMRKTRIEVEITTSSLFQRLPRPNTSPNIGRDSLELALSLEGLEILNRLGVLPLKWEKHQYMVDIVREGGD